MHNVEKHTKFSTILLTLEHTAKKLKSPQHKKVVYTHHKQNTKMESTSYQQVRRIFFFGCICSTKPKLEAKLRGKNNKTQRKS